MRNTMGIAAIVVFVVVTAESAWAGDPFTPKEGKCTVEFPGKPKEVNQTARSPIGELKIVTATYATGDANILMLSYTDFPTAAIAPDSHASVYDGVREGLKAKDGKVVSEKAIEVGAEKLPGREIVIDKGKQQIRFRVVLRENRLYQVATLGTGEYVTGKEATRFLESFTLTK